MFPTFRDSGPFLNLLPFPTGGGSSVTVTPGTPSVVGTEITFPATSDRSLVGALYGVEFGIGVGAGYVWSESVAGAASSQTITIDIATYGGTTSSTVNARLYYNLDLGDAPSTRVYSAMLAPIVVSASETGTTTEGQTLTGANGIIVGGYQMTLSQSWSACNTAGTSCTPISAGTATTYVLTASEVGDTIKYTKTATNTAGSGSATSAASAVVAGSGDPYWTSVVLLAGNEEAANGSTSFTDQSNNAFTLTRGGTADWSNTSPPTGLTTTISVADGSSGVSAADNTALDFGSGDFTIEGFVNLGNAGSRCIIAKGADSAGNREWWIQTNFGGEIGFSASSDGTSLDIANNKALKATWTTGQWYHFAVCRSTNTWYAFLDGVQGSTWSSSSGIFNGSSNVTLGAFSGLATGLIGSYIASVRLTKGVARYTANFTPPDLPLLSS